MPSYTAFSFIRSLIVACCNGFFTLVILLIAPLGLAAVITTTLLVMVSSFLASVAVDRILKPLSPRRLNYQDTSPLTSERRSQLKTRQQSSDIEPYF
ncbi:CRISPR-associated protein Csx18 [Parathermosynechococcus lividus]